MLTLKIEGPAPHIGPLLVTGVRSVAFETMRHDDQRIEETLNEDYVLGHLTKGTAAVATVESEPDVEGRFTERTYAVPSRCFVLGPLGATLDIYRVV